MAGSSKWIEGRPDDSVRRVARRALEARLRLVWRYLRLSASMPPTATENVHQLRVFSRRAATALAVFEDWLPRKQARRLKKRVKQIRRAANEARDCDVLFLRLSERALKLPTGTAAALVQEIQRRRDEAQPAIDELMAKLSAQRFPRQVQRTLAKLRHGRGRDSHVRCFGNLARATLAPLVNQYLQAGDADLSGADALHAFRIQGKEVRYAMEIFAGVFDVLFRQELYPVVAALQERLGAINDHVTAERRFTQWHAASASCAMRQALEAEIEVERAALEVSRQEFLAWWTAERRAHVRDGFARYVSLDPAPHRCTSGKCRHGEHTPDEA